MRRTDTEGHGGVPIRPLRLVKAAAVTSLALAPVVTLALPAAADTVRQQEWFLATEHVIGAWKSGTGAGVIVALLSDGVDGRQADLAKSVVSGPDFTRSGRAPGSRLYGLLGTGLASLIVGHGHGKGSADGIIGVAPDSRILSIRVTLSPGDPLWRDRNIASRLPDAIALGIRYAVAHGATVIDLPADPANAGGPGSAIDSSAAATGRSAERAAIAYAERRNVVLIAPAGDNALAGDAPAYPAAYPDVISVGAFGPSLARASFSSLQPYVTLTAAGQGVEVATPTGYQAMNSTNASSAIAAGVAALVRSQFPNLTAAQVRGAMIDGTLNRPQGAPVSGTGYGALDALGPLNQAMTMSPPHAMPAMESAKPRIRPAAPSIPSESSVIVSDLTHDGVLSAALLLVLIVPIAWYGSAARKRERRLALAAEQDRLDRIRSGQAAMLADPLLEFFGPQHARPAERPTRARLPTSPRFQPTGGMGASSFVTQSRRARLGFSGLGVVPRAITAGGPDSAAPAGGGHPAAESGGWSRSGTWPVRRPGPGSLGGPAEPGAPPYRGDTSFRGEPGYPGEPSFRGEPGFPGEPGFVGDPAFRSEPVIRREPVFRGEPPPGGEPAYGTGPAFGAGSAFGAGPDFGGGPTDLLDPGGPTMRAPRPPEPRAQVTGSPPWGPAPEPTSELPWTVAPAPPGTGPRPVMAAAPTPPRPAPPESVWDEAPPSRPSTPAPGYGTWPRPADIPQQQGGERRDSGGRPIYVWNPEATADVPIDADPWNDGAG
jgi:hypothetical protein